jgi:hypothetical protein
MTKKTAVFLNYLKLNVGGMVTLRDVLGATTLCSDVVPPVVTEDHCDERH